MHLALILASLFLPTEEHKANGPGVDTVSPETACAGVYRTELPSCDTLLISNLPENASEFLVEMYFENPKSGGCEGAIEKIHFIKPKVAQVKFKDPQGEKLKFRIILMLCNCMILPILVATSILSKEGHILQGSELVVQYYSARDEPEDAVSTEPETGPTDTLEVRNLPHSVSTDALLLYFESPKSGGCADGVKEITFIEPGVACVQLTDATGECRDIEAISMCLYYC